jgi:hypothetical protein
LPGREHGDRQACRCGPRDRGAPAAAVIVFGAGALSGGATVRKAI